MALSWLLKCPDLESRLSPPHQPCSSLAATSLPSAPSPPLITQLIFLLGPCALNRLLKDQLVMSAVWAQSGLQGYAERDGQPGSPPSQAGCPLVRKLRRAQGEALLRYWPRASAQLPRLEHDQQCLAPPVLERRPWRAS